jgi:hypothetical protein
MRAFLPRGHGATGMAKWWKQELKKFLDGA